MSLGITNQVGLCAYLDMHLPYLFYLMSGWTDRTFLDIFKSTFSVGQSELRLNLKWVCVTTEDS